MKINTLLILLSFCTVAFCLSAETPKRLEIFSTVITGKIEKINESQIVIISKWKSRSRVSYIIIGDDTRLRENLGKYARVTGKIENISRWKKKLYLEKIISIDDIPFKEDDRNGKKD